MTCDHDIERREEVMHLCNIRHNTDNSHKNCDTEYCQFERTDCPHIFGFQVCECGQKFVGKLGDYHSDTATKLEEKI